MKMLVLPKKTDHDLSRLLHSGEKSFFLRRPFILVFLIGVLATLITAAKIYELESARRQNDFDRLAKAAAVSLEGTLQSTLGILQDIGSFYSASHTVERDEFKKFAAYLLVRNPNIYALEWIPRVFAPEVSAYQAAARLDGIPQMPLSEYSDNLQIIPAKKRSAYYPVFFVEPYEENQTVLGRDYASHPVKRAAMEKARDSGEPAATSIISLSRFAGTGALDQNGIIIFIPIYRNNMPADTRIERLRNLHGYAALVINVKTLIQNSFQNLNLPEVRVEIFSETPENNNRLIGQYPAAPHANFLRTKWLHYFEVEIAGSRWKVHCTSTDYFLKNNRRWESWVTLMLGLLLSSLLSAYVFSFENRRIKEIMAALSLSDELTQLYNRRGFLLLSEEQIRLALRRRQGFWLLVMDLDGLKKINDTLGHPEGDRALIRTARVLEASFRKSDVLARIGGDEFAAMALESVPGSLPTILTNFQELLIKHNHENPTDYEISISVGASFFDPSQPCSIEDLINRADKELYRQKREHYARGTGTEASEDL